MKTHLYRYSYTLTQRGHGGIPSDWDRLGGVVILENGKYCAFVPKIVPPPQMDTLEEAWEFVESWRMMMGMNEDGSAADVS